MKKLNKYFVDIFYIRTISFLRLNKYGVIFSLFLIAACSNKKADQIQTVQAKPFSDTLQAQTVALKNPLTLLHPFRIKNLNDHYLVTLKLKKNDFIQVYELPDLQLLYKWGRQGKGPNEFTMYPDYLNKNGDTLIIHDIILRALRPYKVTDSTLIKAGKRRSLSYKTETTPLNNIRRISDDLYLAGYQSYDKENKREYVALRPDDKDTLFTFGKYPSSQLTGRKEYQQFRKTTLAKPDGFKFAAFYSQYNKFKIFDDKGNLLKVVHIHDPFIFHNAKSQKGFTYRTAAYASNKYIYTLGIYASSKELKDNASIKTSLEIWTWTGKPVYRAKFDRLIRSFTVSEKYRAIYGFASKIDTLFKYNLPNITGLN